MAEEKVDGLEGLDDFGDDFGEQLDSFMENDGEQESDSELDSFFEDLSTIDDLEGDDDSEAAEDKKEEEKTAEVKSDDDDDEEDGYVDEEEDDDDDDDETEEDQEDDDDYDTALEDESEGEDDATTNDKQKKKKGLSLKNIPLKPLIISSVTGLLLGVITVVVLYFFATPAETDLPETVVAIPAEAVPTPKVSKPEPKKPKKAKAKPKTTSYYVQVVSCISHECVDETRLQLKTLGYKSRVRSSNESSGISEVLSTKVFGEEYSARMVKIINNNNPLAGHAFRKSMENGYQVSLGFFPELETANRVRTYLNQAFKEEIFFKIQRTTQKIRFQAVQIAGFKSRRDAEKLRDKLRKNNPNFKSAFVKAVVKP